MKRMVVPSEEMDKVEGERGGMVNKSCTYETPFLFVSCVDKALCFPYSYFAHICRVRTCMFTVNT